MTPADLTTKRKMAIEIWFDFDTSHWSCGRETAHRLLDVINFNYYFFPCHAIVNIRNNCQ